MTPTERFRRRIADALDGVPPRPRRKYTDQDAAFAVAQWCSGITQKEIAGHFGYETPTMICIWIEAFIRKHCTAAPLRQPDEYNRTGVGNVEAYGDDRKLLAKIAFCHFMAQREEAA